MRKKLEEIKDHLAANKMIYVVGVGGFAAGVVGTLIFGPTQLVLIDSLKLINWNSPHTSQNIIAMQRKGTLSNFVRDVTAKHLYESQNDAAKALGITPGRLSKILDGKSRPLADHILERVVNDA
jgi:hypothetical protein